MIANPNNSHNTQSCSKQIKFCSHANTKDKKVCDQECEFYYTDVEKQYINERNEIVDNMPTPLNFLNINSSVGAFSRYNMLK